MWAIINGKLGQCVLIVNQGEEGRYAGQFIIRKVAFMAYDAGDLHRKLEAMPGRDAYEYIGGGYVACE